MKTTHAARQIVRIRLVSSFLAVVAAIGLAFSLGQTMGARVVQTPTAHLTTSTNLNASVGDLAAVWR